MVFLLLLSSAVLAQEPDLSAIRKLNEKLPDYNRMGTSKHDEVERDVGDTKHRPLVKVIPLDRIKRSGTAIGSLEEGAHLIRIEDNKVLKSHRSIYIKHFLLEDERGFKYVLNPDGSIIYKVESRFVQPLAGELDLYEPPSFYTPAPLNKVQRDYDTKFAVAPEGSVFFGYVDGDYMRDLFNDDEARSGITTQYGLHTFTNWNLPMKVGGVIHYERASYQLTGGSLEYSSLSFGPQFKSKDFELGTVPYRFQLQVRLGPFAKASASTDQYAADFKFNSTDLLASLEHPMKNRFGSFVFGAFYQAQWLNIKDQPEIVSIKASNKMNTAIGLSLAQVFE